MELVSRITACYRTLAEDLLLYSPSMAAPRAVREGGLPTRSLPPKKDNHHRKRHTQDGDRPWALYRKPQIAALGVFS